MGEVGAMAALLILTALTFAAVLGESPFIDDPIGCVKPTPSCPQNEEYRCRNPCPPETCVTLYAAFLCIQNQTCNQGCFCKSGFLRTTVNGTCVPRDECLPLECLNDPNAQRGNGNRCGRTCEDYKDKTKICAKGPYKANGCDCKPGFVYDKNLNHCVKPNECTKQCTKPHERYSQCFLGECIPKTCDDLGKSIPCPSIAAPCAGGCICEQGYVRDSKGNCIDVKMCPSCGDDPNAQSGCGNPCGKTCASLNLNKTDLVCPQYCEENGCDCKDGYLLNTDTKKCTLIKDCPKPPSQCGKNEEYYCGPSCPEANCTNPNPPPCINKKCELKCYCKKGFVRDANNNCVPFDACPVENCTKPHERYISCLAGQCTPKTCDDLGRSIACPFIVGPCPGGCICEEGYLRNAKGTCIKIEQCPPKPCSANQTWTSPCNFPCPNQFCPRNDKEAPPCQPLQPCYPGCQCKPNYRLNATRQCVRAQDCPPVECTGQNEVWNSCASACLAEGCDDVKNQTKPCSTVCTPRCVCKKGYLRNKDGLCIPAAQCPAKCTKPNEKYIDCLAGQCNPKTCKELQTPAPCPRVIPPCPGGCICVDGYVRDDSGTCIKKENCPLICNGSNEVKNACANKGCTPKTCKEVVKVPYCPPLNPGPCTTECVCKSGFVRSSNGTCIAIESCPEAGTCENKNETWVECAAVCAPAYCPKDDQPQPQCFLPAGACHPGCLCKPNYRLNKDYKCILASECPAVPCTRPNEVFSSCPSNRITTCAALGSSPVPTDGPTICNPGCICKKGFYKNDNGTCVPQSECPPVECTGQNEVWNSCASACLAEGCDDVKNQTKLCTTVCSPRCVCKKGYLRNSDGLCIPAAQCPAKCTKPNEKYIDCLAGQCNPKTCKELQTPAPCPRVIPPCPGGCICVDGYVRDDTGTCIKKENCPLTCNGPNEVKSTCGNQRCAPNTCKEVVKLPSCPPPIPVPCTTECVCKTGFVRSCNGTCIAIDDCPQAGTCASKNETWVQCAAICAPAYCPKDDQPQPQCFLPAGACHPGCVCKPNYRINKDYKCILASECPAVPCTRPNEVFSSCPSNSIRTCAALGSTPVPTDGPTICNPGCICKEGFYKNDNGTCVPQCECPTDSSNN